MSNIEVVALDEVLNDVVRQNAEMAQRAHVTLKHMPTKTDARIDPGLLTTILQNRDSM